LAALGLSKAGLRDSIPCGKCQPESCSNWQSDVVDVWELVGGFGLFVTAAGISGVIGFGGGLAVVPFLVMLNPNFIPVPMVLASPAISGLIVWRERKSIDLSSVKWTAVGLAPGIAAGTATLVSLSQKTLGIFISLLLLAGTGLQMASKETRQTRSTLLGGGVLAGFMANTVGMPGVALAVSMSRFEGPVFRSTLNTCVVMMTVVSTTVLAVAGQIDIFHLVAAAVFVAAAFAGFLISGPVRHVVDRRGTTQIVYAVSVAGAITLLIRSLG